MQADSKPIRVLIVDDSALVRSILTEILESAPGIEVVGAARDPYIARDLIKKCQPDVLTLDVEMPRMDGVTFLRNLMRLHPMPVVMVSSLTRKGGEITMEALRLGAVDFVAKPCLDVARRLADYSAELISKVTAAGEARSHVTDRMYQRTIRTPFTAVGVPGVTGRNNAARRLIAIGASTGGTEAISEVLCAMPADAPAIVIAQHIPEAFSRPFAERMDRHSAMNVMQARDRQAILPGNVYISPGDQHLLVVRDRQGLRCSLSDEGPVNRHRPSVDVLFRSVASSVGPDAIGVLLTGMGVDGAAGLKEMREAGAFTVAQDQKTSIVWGMPGKAVALGAADAIASIDSIAAILLEVSSGRPSRTPGRRTG